MRTIALVLVLVLGAATGGCDPGMACTWELPVHEQRCADGDTTSCAYVAGCNTCGVPGDAPPCGVPN